MRKEYAFPLFLIAMVIMYFKVDFLLLLGLVVAALLGVVIFKRLQKPYKYVAYTVSYAFLISSFLLGSQMLLELWL